MFPLYLVDIPPGPGFTRNFDYCVKLDNLTDYPDYVIVVHDPYLPLVGDYYFVMPPKYCLWEFGGYPIRSLFAVPRAQITPGDLTRGDLGTTLSSSHLGTTLSSLEVLNPEVVKSKGIPGSRPIGKPSTVPFWDGGRTITGIYTITALTKDTFTIQYVGNDSGWAWIQLFALFLLGMIVLRIIKRVRSSGSTTSDNNSDTLDNP